MYPRALVVGLVVAVGWSALATDAPPKYFTCPVSRLEISEGSLPKPRYGNQVVHGDAVDLFQERSTKHGPMRILLDGPGAVEIVIQSGSGSVSWDHVFLAIKSDKSGPVTGRFKFWRDDKEQAVRWRMPANANTVRAADWFNYGKAARFDRTYRALLRNPEIPGQAWFRHQINEVAKLKTEDLAPLWQTSKESRSPNRTRKSEPMEPDISWVSPITIGDWEPDRRWTGGGDHMDLLSGGRALSENLQLKRELNVRADGEPRTNIKIGDLKGIDIREYDWNPHVRGLQPQLDPLASLIPADQHAVFFPDMAASVTVLEELDRTGIGILNLSTVRSVDDRLIDRYLKQLALTSVQLGKMLPPGLVNNVAVTGSDLYFDTGTDIAVLFATTKPALVRQLLLANWPAVRTANSDVEEQEGKIGEVDCRTLRSADRRICCYATEFEDAVVLANSPAQIKRLHDVRSKKSPALASLPEYVFFRDRYRKGEVDETAFVMLSDAAIRRWCGPAWRIGHQRRIQRGAYLADAQADQLPSMLSGAKVRTIEDAKLGPLDVGTHSVYSKNYGTRLFQSPIAEAEIEQVTAAEADAYNRWRESYQKNWSQFFDPIAARLTVKPDRLALDISVLPLIASTEYRDFIALSAGAQLSATAGDPHSDALAHFVVGFNRASPQFSKKIAEWNLGSDDEFAVEPWIGDWLAIYGDEDPLWENFLTSGEKEWEFWQKHNYEFPIGVAVAVRDVKKLESFLETIKSQLLNNPNSPQSVGRRNVEYHRISVGGATVHSLVLPDQWVLSLNERVIHRAIDRHLARKEGKPPFKSEWVGDSIGFTAKPLAMKYMGDWWGRSGLTLLQQAAWANLPILNEWHQLDAKTDPVAFHEKWWGERLLEPAGGKYVWNDGDGTMESNLLGHPGRPMGNRAVIPVVLRSLRAANFGITFERDGLRARMDVRREK